jgi:peptide/nickel transport system substrate-binding protein
MKNIIVGSLILAVLGFTSCGGGASKNEAETLTPAENGKFYGGIFRMNEVENFRSLYPLNVTEVTSHRITNQVYEGLVGFDQTDLSIVPRLAESWDVDSTFTSFTFHLRKGVKYHDSEVFEGGKGREVTANDFKYCFTKLCEANADNQGYWVFQGRVKGCEEYYLSTQSGQPLPEGVAGVQVIDDYTLKIELNKTFSGFMNMLALPFTAVFPKEAYDKYGQEMRVKTVGTGPFILKDMNEGNYVILEKNPEYWGKDADGNQLPYLNGIKVTFIKDRKTELLEFDNGKIDLLYKLPLELTSDIVTLDDKLQPAYQKYQLQVNPSLALQYYGFQHKGDLFKNKDLRIAFNYAIDKESIVEYTLKGSGIAATNGVVPPGVPNYDNKVVKGYEYDPAKAREYLVKAGYPGGQGFPKLTLQINSGGGHNEQVAEAIQKMLKENLGIEVEINIIPFAQHLELLETGKTQFWRAGWVADYPDAENFLNLFYSKHIPATMEERSYLNSVRYASAEFDKVFEEALVTVDADQRELLYLKADQIMMNDAAIIPIYYYKDHRLLQPKVRNFPQNSMEYRNLRDVYFVPADTK